MLDGARQADGEVEARGHHLAGLADLEVVRDDACVHDGAGRADRGIEQVGERVEDLPAFLVAQAAAARDNFEQVFSRRELPEDMQVFRAVKAGKLSCLMADAGLAKGNNDARRLIDQGAVRIDGEKVAGDMIFEPKDCVLQVGRRQFRKIVK